MPKKPNFLADKTERMQGRYAFPKFVWQRLYAQEELNELTFALHNSLQGFVDEMAIGQCRVVRYFGGELIVATHSLTLANHLTAISDAIRVQLKEHPRLYALTKITAVP